MSKAWKGVEDRTITLVGTGWSCDYPFEVGETYIVYAGGSQYGHDVRTSICGLTRPVRSARLDLDLFGPPNVVWDDGVIPSRELVGQRPLLSEDPQLNAAIRKAYPEATSWTVRDGTGTFFWRPLQADQFALVDLAPHEVDGRVSRYISLYCGRNRDESDWRCDTEGAESFVEIEAPEDAGRCSQPARRVRMPGVATPELLGVIDFVRHSPEFVPAVMSAGKCGPAFPSPGPVGLERSRCAVAIVSRYSDGRYSVGLDLGGFDTFGITFRVRCDDAGCTYKPKKCTRAIQ